MGHCKDKGPLFLQLSHPHRLRDDAGEVIWGQISPWLRGGEGGKRLHPGLAFPRETGSPFCPGAAPAPGSQMTPSSPVSLPAGEGILCTVNSPAQLLNMTLRAGEVGQGTAQTPTPLPHSTGWFAETQRGEGTCFRPHSTHSTQGRFG